MVRLRVRSTNACASPRHAVRAPHRCPNCRKSSFGVMTTSGSLARAPLQMDDPVVLEDEAAAGVPPEEDVAAVMAPEEDATANRSMTKNEIGSRILRVCRTSERQKS